MPYQSSSARSQRPAHTRFLVKQPMDTRSALLALSRSGRVLRSPVEMNEEVNDNGTVTKSELQRCVYRRHRRDVRELPSTPGTISFTSGPTFSFLIGGFPVNSSKAIRINETDSSNVVLVGFCD